MLMNRRAQSLIEYALIFAAVTAAAVSMGIYSRRSTNAKLKRTAIGLDAAFRDINAPGSGAGAGRDIVSVPEPDRSGPVSQEGLDLLNNEVFNPTLDLFTQGSDAIAAGDITGALDLVNQGLNLLNASDFSQLGDFISSEPDLPGVAEIAAGIEAKQQSVDLANQANYALVRALDLSAEAEALLARAGAATTPEERAEALQQREEALQQRDAALVEAGDYLSAAISSLSSAQDLLNRGIDLMNSQLYEP